MNSDPLSGGQEDRAHDIALEVEAPPLLTPSQRVPAEPINILIVDDEPKNLLALETVLDDPSYHLISAGSADEALLALVAREFALLILDIQMPGMNGFELAQMIKQRKKTADVPIIFLTAFYSEDEHVLEGYSTGAVDYLHKPINATTLRSKVAVFAALHRKTRESAAANRALLVEVTERQRAQEQLRELNEMLEQRVNTRTAELSESESRLRESDRRKDEFLAMLGHELRNPLAAIRHAVRITSEFPEDASEQRWAREVIDRQSTQLTRMVDDLLDVERINRGRIELQPEPLELGPVLIAAMEAVRPLMDARRHAFSLEPAPVPLWVQGDAARLEQVFVNLLNNAAKYTPEGGQIRLAARSENQEAVIAITDNGVGIAADLLSDVFDLFTQAHTSLDRAEGGLGIGLTVVRSLVEMHGGRVSVESGGALTGTTFTVRLPIIAAQPAASAASEASSHQPPRAVRVLVVDDHADAAEALRRLLVRKHCEVRIAHDGPAGMALAREFRPEVLLLDLGLPGLDGYELARTLRGDPIFADAVFIAISGYAQERDRARSLAAGFKHHYAKPVDFISLLTTIQRTRAGE